MKISQNIPNVTYIIQSYNPGQIVIKNHCYTNSLIVMPELIISNFKANYFADIQCKQLDILIKHSIDILLIGTDERINFTTINRSLFNYCENHKIGMEIMNIGAACRTYNLLVTEDRNTATILLIR